MPMFVVVGQHMQKNKHIHTYCRFVEVDFLPLVSSTLAYCLTYYGVEKLGMFVN